MYYIVIYHFFSIGNYISVQPNHRNGQDVHMSCGLAEKYIICPPEIYFCPFWCQSLAAPQFPVQETSPTSLSHYFLLRANWERPDQLSHRFPRELSGLWPQDPTENCDNSWKDHRGLFTHQCHLLPQPSHLQSHQQCRWPIPYLLWTLLAIWQNVPEHPGLHHQSLQQILPWGSQITQHPSASRCSAGLNTESSMTQ